jgi:hypothetical protein
MCWPLTVLPDETFEANKQWFKHSSEPWPKVLEAWEATSAIRVQEARQSDRRIAQTLKEWPRLKDPNGYTLACG